MRGIHLAELVERLGAHALHICKAESLSTLLIADAVVVDAHAVNGAEATAALADGTTEETLGLWGGAEHAHGDTTGRLAADGHIDTFPGTCRHWGFPAEIAYLSEETVFHLPDCYSCDDQTLKLRCVI
jgi:hypothetical protein